MPTDCLLVTANQNCCNYQYRVRTTMTSIGWNEADAVSMKHTHIMMWLYSKLNPFPPPCCSYLINQFTVLSTLSSAFFFISSQLELYPQGWASTIESSTSYIFISQASGFSSAARSLCLSSQGRCCIERRQQGEGESNWQNSLEPSR